MRPYNEVETLKDPPLLDEFGQTNIPKEPAGKQRTQKEIEDLLASAEQETFAETEQGYDMISGFLLVYRKNSHQSQMLSCQVLVITFDFLDINL